ncbi:LSM domain protein [Dictyocaulus viviparus]|uniref:LSM domain protein n=1 Tax=Dictyocaulus viviparus TaxID=29172 RepID=A0A0D8XQY9_DICVI|nr:LSM domain protein [Dictyocaulus viviparus]
MEYVAQYMGRWMEVELTDGRIIRGQMLCTDKQPNFILGRSEERWSGETGEPRAIGLAMVARQHVVRLKLLPTPRHSNTEAVP